MSDPYCTPDEVRHVLAAGADEIDAAETAASLGDNELSGAIEDAQNEVDGKLAARYSGIPFDADSIPPIVNSLSSKFTLTSCEPLMTRLPFGSTAVTTAGTERLICSERLMSPLPCEADVELKSCL